MRVEVDTFRAADAPLPGAEERAALGNAYTLRCDGAVAACAGLVESPLGVHLWSWIAPGAPMLIVHRAARRFLSVHGGRIVATTEAHFGAGCRWLEMLGFNRVRALPGFDDGVDHYLYERAA